MRSAPAFLLMLAVAACATLDEPSPENLARYCTAQNAFRLGSQSKAYFGVCPKETEAGFRAGLQRGRALRANPPQAVPYFAQMDELEKQLLAASSDPERERIRARLRDAEFWAIHIINNPGAETN